MEIKEEQHPAIQSLRTMAEASKYKRIFLYLAKRALPSKSTDIYSVGDEHFSSGTLKEFLLELERLGIGKFLNDRSFSWEGFDLRKVGSVGIKLDTRNAANVKRMEMLRLEDLYRKEQLAEFKEKKLIKTTLRNQLGSRVTSIQNGQNLSSISLEDLLREIGSRGFKVQIEPKE